MSARIGGGCYDQMTPAQQRQARQVMRQNAGAHVDPLTGEVNATQLAEESALDLGAWAEDLLSSAPDDNLWDIAVEEAERHEAVYHTTA